MLFAKSVQRYCFFLTYARKKAKKCNKAPKQLKNTPEAERSVVCWPRLRPGLNNRRGLVFLVVLDRCADLGGVESRQPAGVTTKKRQRTSKII